MTTATPPRRQAHRPDTWEDLIGNTAAKDLLLEAVAASRKTGEPVPHTLLYGPSGMGKTTLSQLLSSSIGGDFIKTTGSTLETPEDMMRLIYEIALTAQVEGQYGVYRPIVVFIDEIHALGGAGKSRASIDPESIYPLLEDGTFYHNLAGKPFSVRGELRKVTKDHISPPPFTLVGATTDPGLLPIAFLRRFLLQVELVKYETSEITEIIQRTADRQEWPITNAAAQLLAEYSRATPGVAYQLLTQVHTRAVATDVDEITVAVVEFVIKRLRLHPLGLSENDVAALELLARRPKGIGVAELSRALGVAQTTFANLQEPYLRMLGLVETLARRVLTDAGRAYLRTIGRSNTTGGGAPDQTPLLLPYPGKA